MPAFSLEGGAGFAHRLDADRDDRRSLERRDPAEALRARLSEICHRQADCMRLARALRAAGRVFKAVRYEHEADFLVVQSQIYTDALSKILADRALISRNQA